MAMYNEHIPSFSMRKRVADLACAGIPKYLIADIIDIDEETLNKHYRRELATSQALLIDKIASVVAIQAMEGNEKSQALLLKTQGAKFGFVEKQVVENINNDDTQELRDKIAALEDKYSKDY